MLNQAATRVTRARAHKLSRLSEYCYNLARTVCMVSAANGVNLRANQCAPYEQACLLQLATVCRVSLHCELHARGAHERIMIGKRCRLTSQIRNGLHTVFQLLSVEPRAHALLAVGRGHKAQITLSLPIKIDGCSFPPQTVRVY